MATPPSENGLQFRTLFMESPVSIIIHDKDSGEIVDANPVACAMYGLDTVQQLQANDFWLDPPYSRDDALAWIRKASAEGPQQFEWLNSKVSGELFWEQVRLSPVTINGVARILATTIDITSLKQTKEALQDSKRRLDMFFSQSLSGFFFMMLDEPIVWNDEADKEALLDYVMTHQRMTKVNQALLDQYGAKAEDFIGLTPADLFAHDPEHGRLIWKGLFDQGRWHVETREQRLDGTPIIIDGDYICLYDEQGRITGHFGVQTDITDRKRAEEELQEKREELDRYFTTSLDLLCIANTRGEFLRLNPEWERVLGYSITELEGRMFLDLVHPDDMQATLDAVSQLDAEEEVLNFENRYRCKDGSYRWIEWRSFPRQGLIYAAARDITERKRVEDELRLTGEELVRSNADLEQFAYAVSHDMRQPLRMVSSYLQLLEKELGEKLDTEVREYLHFAVDGARRMDAMILSLLDYSRVGRKTDPKDWMDSRDALDEALGFLGPEIRDSGGEVRVSGDWPRVNASRDELTRLFQNLVGNALKYRSKDIAPVVDVQVAEHDAFWRFTVKDNGIGFEPSQADRLFKVFSRLHARTRYEGTGVGLALCRKIVEHHGGRIWAESKGPGSGSTFLFTLAKMQDQEPDREAPA